MATEVSIQKTGYGMTEATIAEWLKKEGEQVKEGEPLVTVETEKVNVEEGLIVPIIKDADKKNLPEITKEIRRLASLAKEDALSIEEIKGGTFTISNAGMYGSLFFTPIINQPQSAILGVGKIAQRPVAVDSELVIKPMIYLCLSYDHRIVDGALAQQFLEKVKQNIENFAPKGQK